MHKVYLLLRNNKQTGPYSIDELLQQGLKPYDLVWEDGKSAAWRYPGEIETLKPYAPEAPETATVANLTRSNAIMEHSEYLPRETKVPEKVQNPAVNQLEARHIFVSMPGKAQTRQIPAPEPSVTREEINNKTVDPEASHIKTNTSFKESEVKSADTRYARTLNDVEEDYTNWVFNQSKKKNNYKKRKQVFQLSGIFAGCVIIFFIARTQFAGKENPTDSNLVSMSNTKPAKGADTAQDAHKDFQADDIEENGTGNLPPETSNHSNAVNKNVERTGKTTNADLSVTKRKAGYTPNSSVNTVKESKPSDYFTEKKPSRKINSQTGTKVPGTVPSRTTQKASKGSKIQEPDISSAPSAEVRQGNGRTSTRRDTYTPNGTNNSSPVSTERTEAIAENPPSALSASPDDLQISDNHTEDWMMGISGLKVTVRNKGAIPFKTASVEVLYYDENNRLLDKKTLVFNNIQPKGRVTLPAPDQKWADHVDYRLRQLIGGN